MAPTTQTTLLIRMRDRGDNSTWTEFLLLYRPVIVGFIRARYFRQEADAEDITQNVLAKISLRLETYVRSKGPFRTWLLAVTRNQCIDELRRRAPRAADAGVDLSAIEDPRSSAALEELEQSWEREYQWSLFRRAFERVQQKGKFSDQSLEAYWRLVTGEPPESVGERLGMSSARVALAKHRVGKAVEAARRDIEEEFEER